ncbi:MAG: hypothetical protein JWO25_1313 [Alphaproteobacteria bacterium]|nr:hypothetical protein [Alphaproteobacteria bacterium]
MPLLGLSLVVQILCAVNWVQRAREMDMYDRTACALRELRCGLDLGRP